MEVVKWMSYEDAKELEESIGGLGGFFQHGMRWKDYLAIWDDETIPYAEALKEVVVGESIKEGGDWHQWSDEGVPVFEDGTVAVFSYRAWGDLLAAIWSEEEDKDYSYMDFYMSSLIPRGKDVSHQE